MKGLFLIILTAIISLKADFTQTKTVALMNEPQVSTGHMEYRAPDYLQWEYITPQPVVRRMDGNTCNVNPPIQRLLRMIMASIAGGNKQDEKVMREAKRFFQSIHIVMDEDKEVAKRVEMTEKNGDTTIIEFTNVVAQ